MLDFEFTLAEGFLDGSIGFYGFYGLVLAIEPLSFIEFEAATIFTFFLSGYEPMLAFLDFEILELELKAY